MVTHLDKKLLDVMLCPHTCRTFHDLEFKSPRAESLPLLLMFLKYFSTTGTHLHCLYFPHNKFLRIRVVTELATITTMKSKIQPYFFLGGNHQYWENIFKTV